jgi:serine/threonine-protein kinase
MAICSQCDAELPNDSFFCPNCGTPTEGFELDELLASSASDPTGFLDRLRKVLAGEFVIIRELGRGGMGRVYLAHEIALDRRVAMKVLPPVFADNTDIVQRFQREASTAGKLTHPNIVPVFQVSDREGLYFFTMPYVAGPNLRQILRQTPQLSFDIARRYLCEAADALDYAHGRDVVHRDIKPENMMMEGSRDGRLMLTDFGIAKAMGIGTTLTRPGDLMGTPYFMSPEQCEEREGIDGRSDQYSLGLVGYEMLAGRFPFTADSLAGIVYKHVHEYPEPLETFRPDVPADLQGVVERAIRKDPDERFADMAEFMATLDKKTARPGVIDGSPMIAAPSKPPSRRRWVAAAVFALAIAASATFAWRQWGSSSDPADSQLADANGPVEGSGQPEGDGTAFDVVPAESDSTAARESPDSSLVVNRDTTPAVTPESGGREDERILAARQQAEQAQTRAEGAREAAIDVGADTIFPQRFGAIDTELTNGRRLLSDGEIVAAATSFGAATQSYTDLAQESLQWQVNAAAVADSLERAAEDSTPEVSEPEALPPREAIQALLETYRQLLEAEDMDRLATDVYQGPMPEADEDFLNQLFTNADELDVALEVSNLEIAGDEAEARVEQEMRYRLARTNEPRDFDLSLRMFFEMNDGVWRLRNFEN